jgi:hypothetical protein
MTSIFEHVHRPKKTKVKMIFKNMGQNCYLEATLIKHDDRPIQIKSLHKCALFHTITAATCKQSTRINAFDERFYISFNMFVD